MDYNYNVDTGASGALIVVYLLFILALYVLMAIGLWKMYVKAGRPGWAAIVPIYNIWVWVEMVERPTWWFWVFLGSFLLSWIPIVGLLLGLATFVLYLLLCLDMAKCFGRGGGTGIGLWLLPFVFAPILGFGDARWVGPGGAPAAPAYAAADTGAPAPPAPAPGRPQPMGALKPLPMPPPRGAAAAGAATGAAIAAGAGPEAPPAPEAPAPEAPAPEPPAEPEAPAAEPEAAGPAAAAAEEAVAEEAPDVADAAPAAPAAEEAVSEVAPEAETAPEGGDAPTEG